MKLIYIMFVNLYRHHTKQLSEVCFTDNGRRSVKTFSPAPNLISSVWWSRLQPPGLGQVTLYRLGKFPQKLGLQAFSWGMWEASLQYICTFSFSPSLHSNLFFWDKVLLWSSEFTQSHLPLPPECWDWRYATNPSKHIDHLRLSSTRILIPMKFYVRLLPQK